MTTAEQPPPAAGLSSAEAAARLARFGPNSMVPVSRFGRLGELLGTLVDPMAMMLLVAAAVYLALGERRDAIILGVAAVPLFAVDVIMEARSRRALHALAGAVQPRARVIRDGRETEVVTEALVPGDLLVIGEGDAVHADGVLRWAANLALDESALTGEAEPCEKEAYAGPLDGARDGRHLLMAGSTVLAGHGYSEIVATGPRTRYGEIARLVATAPLEPPPLQRKVARAVRRLLMAAALVALTIFMLRWRGGATPPAQAFLYAITVAISAVPEEFPLVLALFLTLGALRLARRGVLVRRLAAVETLGSTTVICLDKTGTLTHGRFQLDHHRPIRESISEAQLLEAAVLACELHAADPLEQAILAHCGEHGVDVDAVHAQWRLAFDYPFEVSGKHMSHVWVPKSGTAVGGVPARIVAKGALEGILAHCVLEAGERQRIEAANAELANRGMRVLAVAGRRADGSDRQFNGDREHDESGLLLYGLLGFIDPIRPAALRAVAACARAGIRIKLITGDHPLTAHAIAEAAGIAHDDSLILTGEDLARLSPEELARAAAQTAIFARVQPKDKYAIVDALMRAGEIVAMTGDGINDAPALSRANIGIAMGRRGTEVARGAASLVLLDDDLDALTATIGEGRRVFANLQRAFLYLIGFKVMVISLAVLAPLLGLPILLMLVQLVWLELIVHPVSVLAFESDPGPESLMDAPPRAPEAPLVATGAALRSALSGALLAAGALAIYATRLAGGGSYARGVAMTVVIGGSLAMVWAELAGGEPWWRVRVPRALRFWAVLAMVAASVPICMTVPMLAGVLEMRPISPSDWLLAAAIVGGAVGWRAFGTRWIITEKRVAPVARTGQGGPTR
jgi:P-type Ca2+ transporter type 2C